MKATIYAVPKFAITFTKTEIAVLTRCSDTHYDLLCKRASCVGGFLFGWYNCLTSPDEKYPNDEPTAAITCLSRELDTCLKILEMPPSDVQDAARKLARELSVLFRAGQYLTKDVTTVFNVPA